jgi:hypothetical protein
VQHSSESYSKQYFCRIVVHGCYGSSIRSKSLLVFDRLLHSVVNSYFTKKCTRSAVFFLDKV